MDELSLGAHIFPPGDQNRTPRCPAARRLVSSSSAPPRDSLSYAMSGLQLLLGPFRQLGMDILDYIHGYHMDLVCLCFPALVKNNSVEKYLGFQSSLSYP